MKRMMMVVGLVLMLASGMWAQGSSKKPAAAKQTGGDAQSMIVEMENKWVEASKKGDPKILEPILADNYVSMYADGSYKTKKEILGEMGKSKWDVNEISDVKVAVHGNYAQATGAWKGKGMENGKPVDTKERWIDTFVKQPDGSWKAITSGSTTVK